MQNEDVALLVRTPGVAPWRIRLAERVESRLATRFVVVVILLNAVLLGMETSQGIMARAGDLIHTLDTICLAIFVVELVARLVAYQGLFWRSGWRVFDFLVVSVALAPATGDFAVLRALRVLRVLRLLTVVPALRKVVAALLHAIPGLAGVVAVMSIFFYTGAVLATTLYGGSFPELFGSLDRSLFSLFQVMTLDGWSTTVVRPVMEVYPSAPVFFVPFIVVTTFTVLNLFIGIIVATMQELAEAEGEPVGVVALGGELHAVEGEALADGTLTDDLPEGTDPELAAILARMEREVVTLRALVYREGRASE